MQTTILVSIALACSALAALPVDGPGDGSADEGYTFVFIRTGPATDLSKAQMDEAMGGHFANMGRLAEAGELLIAGPFMEPRLDDSYRGIFVFDEPTAERGLALAATDPAGKMGVFVFEAVTLRTDAPLGELTALERAHQAELEANGETWSGSRYRIATVPAEGIDRPAMSDAMPIVGTLHDDLGTETLGGAAHHIAWIVADDDTMARAILGDADGRWTLHGWYGSPKVAELHHD